MKRIIIIGGGFAGLSALRTIGRFHKDFEITLIDQKETFDFLPLLPDIIGRRISPRYLTYSLRDITKTCGAKFLKGKVASIDFAKKEVAVENQTVDYDYLIIAAGGNTTFYGQKELRQNTYILNSVEDAKKLDAEIRNRNYKKYCVIGGGYTGIEIASNIKRYLRLQKIEKEVMIIEKATSILGPLAPWMKDYTEKHVRKMGIEIRCDSGLKEYNGHTAKLATGEELSDAFVVWSAGVTASDFIADLDIDKGSQGRIKVDEYLRFSDDCYAAGDASLVTIDKKPLRMAVQFSIVQGKTAACNIIAQDQNRPLKKYKPVDLGYVVPIANNKSCGKMLNINARAPITTWLHYLMCLYRSYGMRNKWGILRDLFR